MDKAVRSSLQALGYYEPKIQYQWEGSGEKSVLHVKVQPEEAVLLQAADVRILGQGQNDSMFVTMQKRLPVFGQALNHGQYEDYKSTLETISIKRGYFDARFLQKQLAVDVKNKKGYWNLIYDTGDRYRLGHVNFQGSQIDTDVLQNLVPFQYGDLYDADQIAELNTRLNNTHWFNSVLVTPDIFAARSDYEHILPVNALVTPRKANSVELGAGYGTDVGPRGKFIWNKPWLNTRGHSMAIETQVSRDEQLVDFSYKLPLAKNALEHYYVFQGGYKRTDLNDTESNTTTFMVSRFWEPYGGWLKAVHLTFKLDDFTQGEQHGRAVLLYPGVTFSKTRARGGSMPSWGDSQRYTLLWSDDIWGSDVSFVAAEMQHTLIRSYAQRHRFVLRSHLGWVSTKDFENLPPDLRYFAGGDRSLRGYSYESISPRDSSGALTGATKLMTASLEYQYKVFGKWWGAAFVDVGDAVDHIKDVDLKKGVGLGIRWESPLGPIKFDIARPVGSGAPKQWEFYIGLGPEL